MKTLALCVVRLIFYVPLLFTTIPLQAQQWTVYTQTNTGDLIRFALNQNSSNRNELLAAGKDNTIWMILGKDRRLARYNPSSDEWEVFDQRAYSLFTDRKGNPYGSINDKTYKYNGTNWVEAFDRDGFDFVVDDQDVFWFCTRNDDLVYKYDGTVITPVPIASSIRIPLQLEMDGDGFLWCVGTFGLESSVLVQVNGTKSYDNADADIFNYIIFSAEVLNNNDMWVGTYYTNVLSAKGVARLDSETNTWTMFNGSNSPLPNDTIMYLQGDSQNRIWIATNKGLARFDGTNWNVYTAANSPLPSQTVLSVAIDTLGNKWIALLDGLVRFNEITPEYRFLDCGQYVTFVDQSQSIDGAIVSWEWDFAGLGKSSDKNPRFTFPQAGTYTVTLWVTDAMGTRNTIKKQITVGEPVNPLDLGPDVNTCNPSVVLASNVNGIDRYTWTLATGAITAGGPTYDVTTSGKYALEITTQEGCTYSDSVVVVLNHFTTADFTVTAGTLSLSSGITVYPGTTITFTADTDAASWDFGNGALATGNPVTFSYSQPGTYTVQLDAGMDERQCPLSHAKVVEVADIFIANAITPDGDGKNDELLIDQLLDEASIKVVNRWGQPVYERAQYTGGFAGTGLESGVYYYELRFRNFDNVFRGYVHIIK